MNRDGMSTAIAMHGSRDLSKRAKRANDRLLKIACFGSEYVTREDITGKAPEMTKQAQVDHLRSLARMAGKSQAKILLRQAEALESTI